MPCTPSPFPLAVLAEATRISPTRRTTSDGICGDPAHQAEVSDHDPDARGIPHAVDISQSMPGAPFWTPAYGQFDAHAHGLLIAARIVAGTEHRVKYLVSNYGHGDVIFDPVVSLTWRPNATGDQHQSHLHVSFLSEPWVEQSTAPLFQAALPPEEDMPLNAADIQAIRDIVQQELEAAVGGASLTPPDAHATVADVVKHYAKP